MPDFDELEAWADAQSWRDVAPSSALREVMHEDYADADEAGFEEALDAVLDGMSAAESFSFSNALRQIERGASRALSDPTFRQVAQTALPVGAGALGTLIGGPAGTAIGSRLGSLAAGSLAPSARAPSAPGVPTPPATPVAGGSAAAAQGLVLTQRPDVLKALAALAMGRYGTRQVGGVPVASVMNMLSQVFGQAAADADELAYLDGETFEDDEPGPVAGRPALTGGRSLYTALIDAENEELAR